MNDIIYIGIFVGAIIVLQFISFFATKKKIKSLRTFFPNVSWLERVETSITKTVLETKGALDRFVVNPPAKHVKVMKPVVDDDELEEDSESNVEEEDYTDLYLIKLKNRQSCNEEFKAVVDETNTYLCKNTGTSADYGLLQDISERKLESLEASISNTINVPLYLGLCGTFIGIIFGVFGISGNIDSLFAATEAVEDATEVASNMQPLQHLLWGVGVAMVASLMGLGLMVWNSAITYKKALSEASENKNEYYDFLRRELMPVLSNSMASSLNSLKGVLGNFVDKFGKNLDDYANSAELLNDNIEKQHLLLVEVNKMQTKEISEEVAASFKNLHDASESLSLFRTYQQELNDTLHNVSGTVEDIKSVLEAFENFSSALNVVVQNQETAARLQQQFKESIELHFPSGPEGREVWRKQFDLLTTDAKTISDNLNEQFKQQTEYIKEFVEENKSAFDALSRLNDTLETMVNYTKVQAECYSDLKEEIRTLKEQQAKSEIAATDLQKEMLKAVKEMTMALRDLKK